MSEIAIVTLLCIAGLLVFTAEIFIPSHGVLTIVGFGFLTAGVVRIFMFYGQQAGFLAVLACVVLIPVFVVLAVKIWPHTPVGRRVAPPNPIVNAEEGSIPFAELSALVGATGRCVSPLRPVGICEFRGCRVSCVSQMGMIEAGKTVLAIGLSGGNLTVVEQETRRS